VTLERQKKLGVVPATAKLAPKPTDIKDGEGLSADGTYQLLYDFRYEGGGVGKGGMGTITVNGRIFG